MKQIKNKMQPNKKLITIKDNEKKIEQLLQELVFQPRLKAIEWSRITHQTPNIKIGYPGQHLASLVTGMLGERTGARGNDIIDGTEVKSCSRIDQLDKCNDCNLPVARLEKKCPHCSSTDITRNNDSKWLFTIRDENDLMVLLHGVKRILLLIGYYPFFDKNDFDNVRITAYEIWPESKRQRRFGEIMTNYYEKIYLAHRRLNPSKTPAPKNFWPFQYQFYLCNPVEVFSCDVTNINVSPKIKIIKCVPPETSREQLVSVDMPSEILTLEEITLLLKKAKPEELKTCLKNDESLEKLKEAVRAGDIDVAQKLLPTISEVLKNHLPLRDTDIISVAKTKYQRRNN